MPEKCPQRLGETWSSSWIGVGPGALQHAHGAINVHGIAEAGIGIDDERQLDRVAHRGGVLRQIGEAHETEIGYAEVGVGEPGAGDIDRLEAEPGDDARRQRVGGAGHEQAAFLRQFFPQHAAGIGTRCAHRWAPAVCLASATRKPALARRGITSWMK